MSASWAALGGPEAPRGHTVADRREKCGSRWSVVGADSGKAIPSRSLDKRNTWISCDVVVNAPPLLDRGNSAKFAKRSFPDPDTISGRLWGICGTDPEPVVFAPYPERVSKPG